MKYKALFLDVDGTILPYRSYSTNQLPSDKVTKAIQDASKKVHVCLATGRPLFMLEHILEHLHLKSGLAVINDGAQVMEIPSRNMIYKKSISKHDTKTISDFLIKEKVFFYLNDGISDAKPEKIPPIRSILNIFTMEKMSENRADELVDKLSSIVGVKISKTHDGDRGTFELLISHAQATKLHGIIEASKYFKVKREETIGVGDSGNDFALLMASGYKVAMGNAIESLKDIADYVAPSVEEDGVADVIEKFILPKKKLS